MQSRVNPSLPTKFHEIGEYNFQELRCDILSKEDTVATREIFGTRGQRQKGIDLLARRKEGTGTEVAQCKCYEDLAPVVIRKASDEFFEHLDHWKSERVKRFVLIAACPLDSPKQHAAIQEQAERFRQHDIAYEAWSARPAAVSDLTECMGPEWTSLLYKAVAEGGYLVDYLPLTTHDEERRGVHLPQNEAPHVINCRSLVDALRRDGALLPLDHEKTVEALGNEGI